MTQGECVLSSLTNFYELWWDNNELWWDNIGSDFAC